MSPVFQDDLILHYKALQFVFTLANIATLVATKSLAFSIKFTASKQGSAHLPPEDRAVFPSGNQPLTHTCIIWWFNHLSILCVFIPIFHLLLNCVSAYLVRKTLLSARIHAQSEILKFPALALRPLVFLVIHM